MSTSSTSMIEVFSDVLCRLESEHIRYMIVGSIASMVYGEPRLTKDMDLVLDVLVNDLSKFGSIFPIEDFYCSPIEVLRDEFVRRGQFNIIHPTSGLKIDCVIRKNNPHAVMEFSRRQKIELWPGVLSYVASPEDVILKKLDSYREGESQKHLLDIKGILAQTTIDQIYLMEWVKKLRLEKEWDLVSTA